MNKRNFTLIGLAIVSLLLFSFNQLHGSLRLPLAAPTVGATAGKQKVAYHNISAQELKQWINSGKDMLLIDVREPSEFQEGYLPGAVNIPLGQLENRLQEISKDKDVVLYCRSGRRSALAADIMVKNGFQRVFNLAGGILSWH
ncbi:rhodanese-like domain-containing protein [Desulforamulus hydrothermalis]|uniref:Rhodanese-like protein n=1 Tax=Desulforamulus hydrothermalis Lam5 = DSM 18033 TaxID=1121428 RepID=K8DYL4_9FIRM